MEDLAKEIIECLQLEDRPSRIELVAKGFDYQHPDHSCHSKKYRDVLRVSAHVEKGNLIFKVSYFDNHDRNCMEWVHLEYLKEDVEGVVGFIDGFMSSGVRAGSFELKNAKSGAGIGRFYLEKRADEQSTRLMQIRNAVKSLCAK